MLRILLSVVFLNLPVLAGDRLVVCGGVEVFQLDPSAAVPEKLWSWRANDCAELPADLVNSFRSTDDCKPLDDGTRLLISSSSGGCALLELPSGKALWWARVQNAHSIEALPGGLIAVAASTGAAGNKVVLFDKKVPLQPLFEIPLHSAHGLVWDNPRKILWVLGYDELLACTVDEKTLTVKDRYQLPDVDGHDLRAVPGSADLILSTHGSVHRFDRDNARFREDPALNDRLRTKSLDLHPATGRVVIVQAAGDNWWSDTIEFLDPAGKIQRNDEVIYKVRWLPAPR